MYCKIYFNPIEKAKLEYCLGEHRRTMSLAEPRPRAHALHPINARLLGNPKKPAHLAKLNI